MTVAVTVTVSLVSLIAAASVAAALIVVITSVAHVVRHGNGHGLRDNISGSVFALNCDRVNPAVAPAQP
jgi:hypothetical protein